MTPDKLRELEEWFHAALALPVDQRLALLDKCDATDPELSRLLARMLDTSIRDIEPALSLTADPSLPESIGAYRVLSVLGEGGSGVVYLAEQVAPVRRRVAIKVLRVGLHSQAAVARFEAERQTLASLDHPNIAKVLDAGTTDDGRPFLVMEVVHGCPVSEYASSERLPLGQRLLLIEQVCRAVQHAHAAGVIHRDLKPGNLLAETRDGHPFCRVIDFGIARLAADDRSSGVSFTEQRSFIGTPAYMSPEQARGGARIDVRSDVYSLGAVLYELLTGTTPIDRNALQDADHAGVIALITQTTPRPASVRRKSEPAGPASITPAQLRGDVDNLLAKALDKDPDRRYQTADAMAEDIRRHLERRPILAARPSVSYLASKFICRHRAATAGVAAATIALAAGLGSTTILMVRYRDQKLVAEQRQEREKTERQKAETAEYAMTRLAEEYASVFRGLDAAISRGRDTEVLKEMAGVAEFKLNRGDFAEAPAAEIRLANTLGGMYRLWGEIERADLLLTRAYELGQKHLATSALLLSTLASDLGALREDQRRLPEAEALYRRAVETARAQSGSESVLSYGLGNLGLLFLSTGRDSEAEIALEEALHIQRGIEPDADDHRAKALNNVGGLYMRRGDFAKAETLFREALTLLDAQIPGDHPMRTILLSNIALCAMETGRFQEALGPLKRAVDIGRRLYPGGSPELASALDSLAMAKANTGHPDQAEPLLEESLVMKRRRNTPDDDHVGSCLNSLGLVKQAIGKPSEAEPLLREALKLRQALFPNGHIDIADSLGNLGSFLFSQGRYAEAEPFFRESLRLNINLRGPEHSQVAFALNNLGLSLVNADRFEEAQTFLQESLDLRRKTFPADSSTVLSATIQLALNSLRVGRPALAVELNREAYDLRVKQVGVSRDVVLEAAFSLADAMIEQASVTAADPLLTAEQRLGLLDEAEPLLQEVMEELKAKSETGWRVDHMHALRAASKVARVSASPTLPLAERLAALHEAEPLLRAGLSGIEALPNLPKPLGDLRRAIARDRLRRLADLWDQLEPGAGKRAEVESEFK